MTRRSLLPAMIAFPLCPRMVVGLLLATASVLGTPQAAAQIPYGTYETWHGSDTSYHNPESWSSLNEIHYALGYREMTVLRSTESLEGDFAMDIRTRLLCNHDSTICYLVPGVAVLGELIINPSDLSITTPGLPYTDRPESLNGYFKFFPVGEDTAVVRIELSALDSSGVRRVVGDGEWRRAAEMPQYDYLNLPITYYSEDTPDKLRIFVYSGVRNEAYAGAYPIGTRLLLDWVKMGANVIVPPPPTGIDPASAENSWQLYPQPAHTGSFMVGKGKQAGWGTVRVYDAQGRLIQSRNLSLGSSPSWLDWSTMQPGWYLVEWTPYDGSPSRKPLLLQH